MTKKFDIKKSSINMSINDNIFTFGKEKDQDEEEQMNKEMELKYEINQLIKERNNLEDKLALSNIENEKLQKIIDELKKENDELKKK